MRLADKVALITGAASGIGQGVAELFAAEGAKLALVDQAPVSRDGAVSAVGDVSLPDFAESATRQAIERHGRLDILVTAAGVSGGRPVPDTDPADWDRVFAVNVRGTYLFMRAAIPLMIRQGNGAIVTIASQLALSGGRGNSAYVASKAAVIGLTRTAAVDHAAQGIRINSVLPGATETPMLARSFARQADPEAARERSRLRHPMQRFGQVPEIAEAVLYLASDQASFTTGVCLPVDGGWTAA
jgi:2-keto-3-deoxy-L-fuconate dehydrogenase